MQKHTFYACEYCQFDSTDKQEVIEHEKTEHKDEKRIESIKYNKDITEIKLRMDIKYNVNNFIQMLIDYFNNCEEKTFNDFYTYLFNNYKDGIK